MQKAVLAKIPRIIFFALPIFLLTNSLCSAQQASYSQDAATIAQEIAKQKQQDRQKSLQLIDSLYQSGKRYYKQGEYEKAIDAFRSVLELDPKNLNAAKYIEQSEQKLEQLKKKKAEELRLAQIEAQKQKLAAEQRAKALPPPAPQVAPAKQITQTQQD